MTRRIRLLPISYEMFNYLCSLLRMPPHESAYTSIRRARKKPKFYGRIIESPDKPSASTDPAGIEDFRLRHGTLRDLIIYLQGDSQAVVCAHPVGHWPISLSQNRTLRQGEHYFRELESMEARIDELIFRTIPREDLSGKFSALTESNSFTFFKRDGWLLRRINHTFRGFSSYNYGELDAQVKINPRVYALYIDR